MTRVQKQITIRPDQEERMKKLQDFNFSAFVQAKFDEYLDELDKTKSLIKKLDSESKGDKKQ